jgi:transketolase
MVAFFNQQKIMPKNTLYNKIRRHAYRLRYWSLVATSVAGSGHPTSCLSAADIVATLFFGIFHPTQHDAHFILSKGHAAPLLYAAWHELGVINTEELLSLRSFHSILEGHPTARFPLAEAATGSLGQGLSIGIGYTLAEQLKETSKRTYVLLGDAECAEGSVWEAAELASYYKLHNLIGIIDLNRLGQSGETMDGWNVKRMQEKWNAFGWNTISVNGHNIEELMLAYSQANATTDKPSMIIAHTVKGYGVEQCENREGFHGKVFPQEELPNALQSLAQHFPEDAHEL